MSEFKASGFRDEFGNAGPDLVGITTMTSPYYFVPPSGTTAERPSGPPPGMLRFNTDIGRLEVWRGDHWAIILGESPNLGDHNAGSGESRSGTGTRGVFMGGHNEPDPSSVFNIIDYITIPTLGNAVDFGNLLAAEQEGNAFSSSTRGFHFGGDPADNEIETIVFASTGDATDFGDLTTTSKTGIGMANATRGIAYLNNGNVINYVTMAATGTAVDFGDATFSGGSQGMGGASSVRGVFGGIYVSPSAYANLDYITISSTGNGQDFGDLKTAKYAGSGASNSTRAVFMNGYTGSAKTNNIDFITISTLGNAQDFGDTTASNYYTAGSASSTRMVSAGGGDPFSNIIEYIEIPTTGNASDFGDLTQKRRHLESCSNGHGGL